MIDQKFVPIDIAFELKEIDFKEDCFGYYMKDYDKLVILFPQVASYDNMKVEYRDVSLAPLFQQAFGWFRENHSLYVEPCRDGGMWSMVVRDFSNEDEESPQSDKYKVWTIVGDDYYRVEIHCLEKLIEIVKNKK